MNKPLQTIIPISKGGGGYGTTIFPIFLQKGEEQFNLSSFFCFESPRKEVQYVRGDLIE